MRIRIYGRIKSLGCKIMACLCYFLPLCRNKIVVDSYFGKGYRDNPKYIVEKLLESNEKLHIIWLVASKEAADSLPEGVHPCDITSPIAVYHLTTAAVWIDNCRKNPFFYKKKRQLYLQTWHGTGCGKKVEKEIAQYLSQNYVKAAIKDATASDLMISDSVKQSEMYFKYYWFDGLVAEIGSPRNDIFQGNMDTYKEKVRKHYNLAADTKLLLYAPTFRNGDSFEPYAIDYDRILKACKERFGGHFVALVHLHPNIIKKFDCVSYDQRRVIDTTDYPDMQELIAASDIMVSDYSSAIFDFVHTFRPSFRFATDIDAYSKDRGGMCFGIDEYPYPLARSNDELEKKICTFDEDRYREDVNRFFSRLGEVVSDHASCDAAGIILEFIRNGHHKEKCFEQFKDLLVSKTMRDN